MGCLAWQTKMIATSRTAKHRRIARLSDCRYKTALRDVVMAMSRNQINCDNALCQIDQKTSLLRADAF